MTEPGDEIAAGAGGHSHLRASHADREQVIGMLKAAIPAPGTGRPGWAAPAP